MHDDVQPNYIVDSYANYTSDSNMIPYEQYVKDNVVSVVQRNVSSVPNDAYMMIFNDMHKPHAQPVSVTTRNTIVDNLLTVELATYKEQVKLYERRARFELTEREQRIDEQLRIVITDRNVKEETLKKELHSLLSYKNLYDSPMAKQVYPALYNGYEIIKNNHVPAIVHNTEDTLEIAEITRRKMNDKMKDPECVTNKISSTSETEALKKARPRPQDHQLSVEWGTTLNKRLQRFVPRVLPTKSQVKINIFTLIQLFLEFEKTCKKRITPTGLTEGERGFEQTKECYLKEVIPFFKTLKEHFEGIQKALTKEIKEMKDVFEELEAEVDQNVVDRKHDEIERKNLLIAHDNLIADFLSKEVFYVATNFELNVSRFTEMHDAHTIVEARCLELEAELSNLRDKIQNDNHNELVKWFSNLEVNHLNLQLKYQNLKENFRNNPSTPARDTPDFDSAFVIRKMKASLQGKDNITQLTEKVTALQEQNKIFRAENAKIKQHYKELSILIKAHRVNCYTNASGSQPKSNTKKNKISSAKSVNKKKVEEHPRTNKSNLRTTNRVDSSSSSKGTVKFFRSKDETPEVVIKFLKQIQVGLNKTIRYIRTDNGTEFVNKDLTAYYERVGIFHQKTVLRTPQQNDVVERRNHTLVEATRTMLIFSKAPMFLWTEAVLLLVTPKTDPLFTLFITKPHMSWCMIRSLILPFSVSVVLFVTLQMTTKILENYN
ncbi:retrovirus-related pol polyprotein from transposon TNT 1-94 [Tanacetum coccineum]